MNDLERLLPRTAAIFQEGIAQGLHTGAQVFVARSGETLINEGLGEARPGVPMTSQTIMHWLSAGKPVTVVAIAQLCEQGRLDWDDRVAEHVPEFSAAGKQNVTLRQLLTHTSGLPVLKLDWPAMSPQEILAALCETPLVPGEAAAAYQPQATWILLGEIIQRVSGRGFEDYVRAEIFEPLEMTDCWFTATGDEYERIADRLAVMSARDPASREMRPLDLHSRERCAHLSPGGGFRAPAGALGKLYEMLRQSGTLAGRRVLQPQTVAEITRRQREGVFDETLRHRVDFGLGVIVDSNRYGEQTVPYGFGRHCSTRTFGHGGSQSSIGFCDPEAELVVVVGTNGMPGEPRHNRRNRAINTAIYEDLQQSTGIDPLA